MNRFKKIEEPYNEEEGYPEQIDTVIQNTNEIIIFEFQGYVHFTIRIIVFLN